MASTKILSSTTLFNIDNNKRNQQIRIYFEGSCDTEDWRNYAKNTALPSQEYITLLL